MRKVFLFLCLMIAGTVALSLSSCGGDDDSGGNSGGGTPSATFNIVGTWRAYYQSNDPSRGQVYDLVSFNADHTGYVIEEVGYGSDDKNPINWTMTGNVITVTLDGTYVITWTIQQVIDDNTVIISDGKRNYNVVRDGTGGGGTSGGDGNNEGGGSATGSGTLSTPLTVAQIYDIVSAMPPNSISSTDYYAKGKISRIKYSFSSQYGTAVFNISDNGQASGKQFTIYSAYYKAMRQNWTDGDTQVNVGDEVVVCGKVVNYNATTPEFAERECYVVTINGK